MNQVWLVTGASKGLGLELIKTLLQNGYSVAATSRTIDKLINEVNVNTNNFLPLAVNTTDEKSVKEGIEQTLTRFGKIDVVVNNAGYGLGGAFEELTNEEVRKNFDVNVFGTLNVVRNIMPHFRQQKAGHIFNIASISGYIGGGLFGSYCASKFAVIGLSESLAAEAKPFGIKVTCVAPGYFRTNFLATGSLVYAEKSLDAYKDTREKQRQFQSTKNGQQEGDPHKAALALIKVSKEKNPPVHLLLGTDALGLVKTKIDQELQEFEDWKYITCSTDY